MFAKISFDTVHFYENDLQIKFASISAKEYNFLYAI